MKNNKIVYVFLSMFLVGLVKADIPTFKKSWEVEVQEAAEYYCNPNVQTVEDVKKEILSTSKKLHFQDTIASLSAMIEKYLVTAQEATASWMLDMKKTFDRLKDDMSIPQEVEIAVCFDQSLQAEAFMSYDMRDRTVYMYPSSIDMSPSYRLYTMRHELTHAQQHKSKGMLEAKKFSNENLFAYEREADSNAAESIKCPLCMKAILAYQLLKESTASEEEISKVKSYGYLVSDDLKQYLQKKSLSDLCTVHKSVKNQDIWSGLDTQEGCMEIYKEDFEVGSMFDRLS